MAAIVTTRQGKVQGSEAAGVQVYKNIPYAASPFGALRYLPPQPVDPWSGVRGACAFGPKPPQIAYPPPLDSLFPETAASGEDCLNLNIWTGEINGVASPVMVWIGGGEFEHVTNADYDGSRFARDGVVCVSINYRVGADGFLYLGDGTANCGLLDQIAALEWVRDNIAAFGGDPDNVTLFGESAGAISIAVLLSVPRADGLFRRAICQSGAAHPVLPAKAAQHIGHLYAERLGVEPTRKAIASVPIDRSLQAQAALSADLAATRDPQRFGGEVAVSMMPWQPVIDGDVIPANPIDRIAQGAGAKVDLMVGSNSGEWRLFMVPSGMIKQITEPILRGAIAAYGLPVDETLAGYRAECPTGTPGDMLSALLGDWYFRIPASRLADAHSKFATTSMTYAYEFAWPSPQFEGSLGACHGLEIPFVFDTLGSGTDLLLGSIPPQQLADKMHAAWIAFASTGRCDWPTYNLADRATMRFDIQSEIDLNPRKSLRSIWGF